MAWEFSPLAPVENVTIHYRDQMNHTSIADWNQHFATAHNQAPSLQSPASLQKALQVEDNRAIYNNSDLGIYADIHTDVDANSWEERVSDDESAMQAASSVRHVLGVHQADKDFVARSNVSHDLNPDEGLANKDRVYDLRARCLMRYLPLAHSDEDTSGDYDPAHPMVDLELPGVGRKRSRRDHDRRKVFTEEVSAQQTFQAANRAKGTLSALAARQNGKILEVIIPFHLSSVGHAYLVTIKGSCPDRWYPEDEEPWNIFTRSAEIWQASSSEDNDDHQGSYRLRKRISTQKKDYRKSRTGDLIGHPEARGCWGCREHRQRCSLLDASAHYPCQSCYDDGYDCELIRQPSRKLACEHCKTKRYACSFILPHSDHSQDCEQCRDKGFKCYACPAPSSIRIGDDGNPVMGIVPRTELKLQTEESVEQRLVQALAADARLEKAKARAQEKNKGILQKREQKADQARSSDAQPIERMGTITTHFAHPMTFMAPRSGGPCHFCTIPLHSHFGWGRTTVTVALSADGRRYSEPGPVSSSPSTWPASAHRGHAAQGLPAGRMCIACTEARIRVILCPGHQTRSMPMDGQALDHDATFAMLESARPGDDLRAADSRCCMLCVCRQATDRCCEKQPEDDSVGCGLALCAMCAFVLHAYNGDLQRTLARHDGKDEILWPLGLRADRAFLLLESQLVKQCR